MLEAAIAKAVTPKDVSELMAHAFKQAIGGDATLLLGLLPYGFSKRAIKAEVAGQNGGALVVRIIDAKPASPDAGSKP